MSKQVHYNIDRLNKENANYNLIIGEKSNGKSYQVKHKEGIEHFLNDKMKFWLLRRWKADITTIWLEKYFSDVNIEKYTNNEFNYISSFRREIFLSKINEDKKVKRGYSIGYYSALSEEQHFSGGSFLDVDRIIFEEFMERGAYLFHEEEKLQYFYSTIDRKRGTTKMYLLGNTITRVCPYLKAWGLDDVLKEMKQGEIRTKEIDNDGTKVKLAIELCSSSGGKNMAIGNVAKAINKGAWQSDKQPKLEKSRKKYNNIFRFGFDFKGFKFLCDVIIDTEEKEKFGFFIYPYKGIFSEKMLVFTDKIMLNPLRQTNIYDITLNNKSLKDLLGYFKSDKIFYSDDLTGTEFKQVINFEIRR